MHLFYQSVRCAVPWTGLAGLAAILFSERCKVSEVIL